jgi:tetratricopeptide (TPR) repeat protein
MWVRLALFTCALAVCATLATGATGATGSEASAALRRRGLELGYNLDHAAALSAFDEAIAADPDDPAPYRLKAAATWISLLFEQGIITIDDYLGQARADVQRSAPTAQLDKAFHDSIRQALTLGEARLKTHPSGVDAHYQVGAAYGFLASYTATVEGRVLGSLAAARRAYREHERVLKLDPSRKDAGLIVGLYRYGVASLPAPLRLMAHLVGFGGGRERGLQMVEEAARYPSDVQANAMFSLLLLYNREKRYDDALHVIAELQHRYPRNRLLWLEAGSTALRAGHFSEARTSLEEGLAQMSHDERPRAAGEEARWRYAYGAALVGLEDLNAGEQQLRSALPAASRDWVRGRIHKELGKIAALQGDRAHALQEYRLAERLCRQDRDAECADQARRLAK